MNECLYVQVWQINLQTSFCHLIQRGLVMLMLILSIWIISSSCVTFVYNPNRLVLQMLHLNLFDMLVIYTGFFKNFVNSSGCYLSFIHDLYPRLMTDFRNICPKLCCCAEGSKGSLLISLSPEDALSLTILIDSDSLLRRFTSAITSFLCNCSCNNDNKR